MEPTIYAGDFLLVDKTAYGPSLPFLNIKLWNHGTPERGDIITFIPPHSSDLYVKRVVGVPGDNIIIENANLFINNTRIPQKLVSSDAKSTILNESLDTVTHNIKYSTNRPVSSPDLDLVIPENKYFVMGDHRNNSSDSRYWGFVDEDKIMGKVNRLALSFSSKRAFILSLIRI